MPPSSTTHGLFTRSAHPIRARSPRQLNRHGWTRGASAAPRRPGPHSQPPHDPTLERLSHEPAAPEARAGRRVPRPQPGLCGRGRRPSGQVITAADCPGTRGSRRQAPAPNRWPPPPLPPNNAAPLAPTRPNPPHARPCCRAQTDAWQSHGAAEPGYAAYSLDSDTAAAAAPRRTQPAPAAPAQPVAGEVVPPGVRSDILRGVDSFVMSLPLGTSPGAQGAEA